MDPENASLHPPTIGDPNVDNSPPAPSAPAESPEVAALRAELERERAAAAEREQRYLQTLDSLMARNAAPAPQEPAAPAAPAVDLNDLPDPVQSPTEFKTKLTEKLTGVLFPRLICRGLIEAAGRSAMHPRTAAFSAADLPRPH